VLEARTPWLSHFGHGQRRKQFNEATLTSVTASIEASSFQQALTSVRAGVATGSTSINLEFLRI